MQAAGRRGLALVVAWLALMAAAEPAQTVGDLYRATVFTTGQGEETRGPALGRALQGVLVKVSGDPRLASSPQVEDLAAMAADYVESYSYRDRMEGIPVHDEQGSRDRPYDLTVVFKPEKIDAALAMLGGAPWTGLRPGLLVVVMVQNGSTEFLLTADSARGRDMRDAIVAAAAQFGMPVALPTEAALAKVGMAVSGLPAADSAKLVGLTSASDADIAISGTLTWSDAQLGWTAEWRMTADGVPYRWRVHRVSFDQAFRSAIGGAAQILSGHGAPN